MSTYTRNFEFRVPPTGGQRHGRFAAPTNADIVIGAPVKANTGAAVDDLGLQPVVLATGAQAPLPGQSGVAVYEFKNAEAFAGFDVGLTTYSDLSLIPRGKAMQVVSGKPVKVAFRNTTTSVFLNTRTYTGRNMISDGSGATPNVHVGDFLTPGAGDDTAGYWTATATAANAWLVVTKVDSTRGEVEAEFVF